MYLVFSTYVEVILRMRWLCAAWVCILHVCGGDPRYSWQLKPERQYSPRMWRWSLSCCRPPCYAKVFSTYVEVILLSWKSYTVAQGILHVCGGDPGVGVMSHLHFKYSPRMWRWSCKACQSAISWIVFSTYVEVIPKKDNHGYWDESILHVCGGDPSANSGQIANTEYSPRMWRWSQPEGLPCP